MSTSGPVRDGPGEQEPLEELFVSVFDMANNIALRISQDEVEARLRRTLHDAGCQPAELPAEQAFQWPGSRTLRDDADQLVPLIARAADGDTAAWNEIIDRYSPLMYSICARYRLSGDDREDVIRQVWLLLAEKIGKLLEPAALPGWLVTTTMRECRRVAATAHGTEPDDSVPSIDDDDVATEILFAVRYAKIPRGPAPPTRGTPQAGGNADWEKRTTP